jgi:hypothetical protein
VRWPHPRGGLARLMVCYDTTSFMISSTGKPSAGVRATRPSVFTTDGATAVRLAVRKLVVLQCLPHAGKHTGFVIDVEAHSSTICSEGRDEREWRCVGVLSRR